MVHKKMRTAESGLNPSIRNRNNASLSEILQINYGNLINGLRLTNSKRVTITCKQKA